jgi:hypothetical protein
VLHWGIAKRECATEAQEFGFAQILKFFDRMVERPDEDKMATFRGRDFFGFWQGLLRVVGSFGDCPRCLAVCPVGNDYHAHLSELQKVVPEKTPAKVEKARRYREARKQGAEVAGLSDWNVRWVGPEGYHGIVARQLQAFKRRQKERESRSAEADG